MITVIHTYTHMITVIKGPRWSSRRPAGKKSISSRNFPTKCQGTHFCWESMKIIIEYINNNFSETIYLYINLFKRRNERFKEWMSKNLPLDTMCSTFLVRIAPLTNKLYDDGNMACSPAPFIQGGRSRMFLLFEDKSTGWSLAPSSKEDPGGQTAWNI